MSNNEKSSQLPHQSPIEPIELSLDSEFQFDCHKGVSCFNVCCKSIDITLTPYDILRLKRRFKMDSREFVGRFTTPFPMDYHDLPGLKLNMKPGTTECIFLSADGCTVYEDRPAACRYYALGSMGVRKKDSPTVDDIFFVVKEDHCKGHEEPRKLTVAQYRKEQGVEKYDEMNREWRDIVLKKRSSGPTVGQPTERSMQLFDMCSYDIESFREFIQTKGFREIFDLSDLERKELIENEEQLLMFAIRFLKQVLFGVMTIPIKTNASETRVRHRKQRQSSRKV